jgi:ATP-binding cassette subfamily B protein
VTALVVIVRKTFPLFGEVQRRLDGLNRVLQENLAGVRVVKAFARAGHEVRRFGEANEGLMARNITAIRASAVTMPLMMLAMNGGLVAAVWLGGAQVKIGSLQAGQLIAFVNYLLQALMSLMMVSMLVLRLARSEASAARIAEVLDSQPQVSNPSTSASGAPAQAVRGRVVFDNVTFSYGADGQDPVLKGISFVAEPGQTVAILGATGAGKSSLVHLIPRFYDATAGRVTLDGVDVRDLDEAVLRQAMAIVLQESVLFTGTIRDNICYGRPDAGEEEVVAAAHMAQAHEFVTAFPEGYDARVGQRGVNLSGGQKQRIAIARALVTRPAVLILDDSTSAVDVATEARIVAGLDAMPHPPTRFIVAQRLSTVLTADMILVLDDGRLVAQGTHAQLLADSPVYRDIYQSQMQNGAVSHGAT